MKIHAPKIHMPRNHIKNSRGIATIEATLSLVVFVLMTSYLMGIFGIIHTGILHSINSRAYAFETIRNRASVGYFRDQERAPGVVPDISHYFTIGFRAHGIATEKQNRQQWIASLRPIARGLPSAETMTGTDKDTDFHLNGINTVPNGGRERKGGNHVWIKTVYGICLNARCVGSTL